MLKKTFLNYNFIFLVLKIKFIVKKLSKIQLLNFTQSLHYICIKSSSFIINNVLPL